MSAVQLPLLSESHVTHDLSFEAALPDNYSSQGRKRIGDMIQTLWAKSEQTLKANAKQLWYHKRHHFTKESLLIRNISRRLMVDEKTIRRWRKEESWPRVTRNKMAARPLGQGAPLFITDDDELTDPLETFIARVYTTRNQQAIWDRYCRLQGVLLPEEIRLADIRYVLEATPITCSELYALFHQEPYSFARYLDYQNLSISMLKRHSSKIPLSTLLNQRPALREIAVRYAQRVYTNRGVPIETLARRLDIEPLDLCSYGTHIGEWRLPHYATLTHIISESVIRNYS